MYNGFALQLVQGLWVERMVDLGTHSDSEPNAIMVLLCSARVVS